MIEDFALMCCILGGRRLYEFLSANLPAIIPTPRVIESKLAKFEAPVVEEKFYAEELKKFLILNNCPLVVSISEDVSALIPKFEYCDVFAYSLDNYLY